MPKLAVTSSTIAQVLAVVVASTLACSGGSGEGGGWGQPGSGDWTPGGGGGGASSYNGGGSTSGPGGGSSGFSSSGVSSSGFSSSGGSSSGFSSSGTSSGTTGGSVSGITASTPLHLAGTQSGCGPAAGECSCTDTTGNAYCGECTSVTPIQCVYCPQGTYCPADPCSTSSTCPSTSSACPSGYTQPLSSLCCPSGYPVGCSDGFSCATDSGSCPGAGSSSGVSSSSSGFGSSSGTSSNCPAGTWTLSISTPATCQSCSAGARLNVTITVSAGLAASGGTFYDSDGVAWDYDPLTCTASESSSCSATQGSLNFNNNQATCYFLCAGGCPGCYETCTLTRQGGTGAVDAGVPRDAGPVTGDAGVANALSCSHLSTCCASLATTLGASFESNCTTVVQAGNLTSCQSVLSSAQSAGYCKGL